MKGLQWQEWESELKKWIEEDAGKDCDLNYHNDRIGETVEPSPDLIVPLLRFQKEWLAWSLNQEETGYRGGILADEMGMEKTVQAISLVLKKRSIRTHELPSSSTTLFSFSTTLPDVFPLIRSTLVICPLAVCKQWVIERWQTLDKTEEDYYKILYKECLALVNRNVEAGIAMNDIFFDYVFGLVLHLRKVADHPYLQIFATEEKDTEQRGSCDDPVEGLRVTSCAHIICKSCLFSLPSSSCPWCSKPLTVDFTGKKKTEAKQSILDRISIEDFHSSTKIEALREEISDMFERDGSAKGIVFSEFSSFLDLIHFALKKERAVCKWMGMRPKIQDLLLSKNLKRILLTEYSLQPSKSEVLDSILLWHQMVVRFLIENTMEENLLKLQEEKKKLFEGAVGDSSKNLRKSRESDLRFILQL